MRLTEALGNKNKQINPQVSEPDAEVKTEPQGIRLSEALNAEIPKAEKDYDSFIEQIGKTFTTEKALDISKSLYNFPYIALRGIEDTSHFQAVAEGLLPLKETEARKKHPILFMAGNLFGLALASAATGGVGTAVAGSKYLTTLPTVMKFAAANMAHSGAAFGLKETVDQAAEFLGGKDKKFNEVIFDVLEQGRDGAVWGAVGSIAKPLMRIPSQMAYGFTQAKLEGAETSDATAAAALYGVFGLLNTKNLNEIYKPAAFEASRKAFVDNLVKKGANPKEANKAVNAYFSYMFNKMGAVKTVDGKKTIDYSKVKTKDFDSFRKSLQKGYKITLEGLARKTQTGLTKVEPTPAPAPATPPPVAQPAPAIPKAKLYQAYDKAQGAVSDPLIEEAKKYKSAEEFVAGQGTPLFHGSPMGKEIAQIKVQAGRMGELGEGFYVTEDRGLAEQFIQTTQEVKSLDESKAGVVEVYGNPKLKYMTKAEYIENSIKHFDKIKTTEAEWSSKKYDEAKRNQRKEIMEEGYDGIYAVDEKQGVIFPEVIDKLKTKSQLTDIWNKANKLSPKEGGEADLIEEAKKYKSAEEFVKAQQQETVKNWQRQRDIKMSDKGREISAKNELSRGRIIEKANYQQILLNAGASQQEIDSGEITVYRATAQDSLGAGAFVTPNKSIIEPYAEQLKETGRNVKIVSEKVDIKDLLIGDEITDFVYAPNLKTKSQLTDIWNKAQAQTKEGKYEVEEMESIEKTIRNLNTEEFEKLIEQRYESGASQKEIDFLETLYAERISEESPDFLTELEGDQTRDDATPSLEELLAVTYKEYITGEAKTAGMDKKDIVTNMRANIENFGGETEGISDDAILDAAKELYETKQELIARQKKPKTIEKLEKELEKIKKGKEERDAYKEQLSYVSERAKEFKNRIRPYKDNVMAEEFEMLDKYFTTNRKTAEPLDEVATSEGFSNEDELIKYLNELVDKKRYFEAEVEARKTGLVKERPETKIKQRIKDIEKGIATGKKVGIEEARETLGLIREFIKDTPLSKEDKLKMLSRVPKALTKEKFEKQIPDIIKTASNLFRTTKKHRLRKSINKELKYTKPVKKGTKRVSKYDYDINKMFDDFRAINKLTKGKAALELSKQPTELISELQKIKNRLLSLKAYGMNASVDLYEQVLKDIQSLKTLGEAIKTDQELEKKLERREMIDEVRSGIAKVKTIDENAVLKAYNLGFSNVYSIINTVAGKEIADKLDPEVSELDKETAMYQKINKAEEKFAKIFEVDTKYEALEKIHDMQSEEHIITDRRGITTKITKAEILDIYNAIKNDAIKERYINSLGIEQLNDLLSNLTQPEIDVADYMMNELQGYRDVINERNIEITGRDIGYVENYWPSTAEHQPDFYDDIKMQGELPSSAKERATSEKIIPIPYNAYFKFLKHITQAEHVKHLSREYEKLMRIFKDPHVKSEIINKYGDKIYNSIINQIENISLNKTANRIDAMSGVLGKAISNWVTAKVALNPTTFARQLVSVGNYADSMPVGTWGKGFMKGIGNPKKTFDYMWNRFPFLESRFNRGYNEALHDALEGAKNISSNKDQWTRGLSSLVRAGDITAIIYGGKPYVDYLDSKYGKDEANKMFKQKTIKTQQSGLATGRSEFQNINHPIARLFLAFKNTMNQYTRLQWNAITQYRNGEISKMQLAKTTSIYSIINPLLYLAAGAMVVGAFKEAGRFLFGAVPEEKTAQENIESIVIELASNPLRAVPVVDDIARWGASELLFGKSQYKIFRTPVIDDLEWGLKSLSKENITLSDLLNSFGTVAEMRTGFPVKSAMRYSKLLTDRSEKKGF